jgi:hypothetical protein
LPLKFKQSLICVTLHSSHTIEVYARVDLGGRGTHGTLPRNGQGRKKRERAGGKRDREKDREKKARQTDRAFPNMPDPRSFSSENDRWHK